MIFKEFNPDASIEFDMFCLTEVNVDTSWFDLHCGLTHWFVFGLGDPLRCETKLGHRPDTVITLHYVVKKFQECFYQNCILRLAWILSIVDKFLLFMAFLSFEISEYVHFIYQIFRNFLLSY